MRSEAVGGSAAKPSRRAAARTTSPLGGKRVKCTISLSAQASQRLGVHASMTGQDRSEVVEKLINENLRRFVVSDRGGPESHKDGITESQN
jgi:hypothetical protein